MISVQVGDGFPVKEKDFPFGEAIRAKVEIPGITAFGLADVNIDKSDVIIRTEVGSALGKFLDDNRIAFVRKTIFAQPFSMQIRSMENIKVYEFEGCWVARAYTGGSLGTPGMSTFILGFDKMIKG